MSPTEAESAPLSDVMLAMDVVDTLRHNQDLVARELNGEAREKQLIDKLREIYHQPAFRELVTGEEYLPGNATRSDAALAQFAREKGGTVFHPVGTCRMGEDEGAVVDASLRVRGVEALRVIDASVMPTMTSANTNAAAIMIGEKGAALVLADAASAAQGRQALAQAH